MSLVTITGIAAGFACVIISITTSGNLIDFFDLSSIFITVGGTLFATIASTSGERLRQLLKATRIAFRKQSIDLNENIDLIATIANVARRKGLLALDGMTDDLRDPFLKKAIMLVVDGSDPELIRSIMETELDMTKARHAQNRAILDSAASYAPAFGMIGTLIGLINMLRNLQNMDSLGSNMSVALVTTFYGSMLANLVFSPLSKRLRTLGENEYLQKELMIEGVLAVQNGENPRIIREKLNSFLPGHEIGQPVAREKRAEKHETVRKAG